MLNYLHQIAINRSKLLYSPKLTTKFISRLTFSIPFCILFFIYVLQANSPWYYCLLIYLCHVIQIKGILGRPNTRRPIVSRLPNIVVWLSKVSRVKLNKVFKSSQFDSQYKIQNIQSVFLINILYNIPRYHL